MKKLLYIYGFNSHADVSTSAMALKRLLPEFDVQVIEYPQENGHKAYEFLQNYIDTNGIDIIVGTSLGGFLCLCLKCDGKIIINPACGGGDDIKEIGATDEQVYSYNEIRDKYLWTQKAKSQYAFFGREDSLLNYKKEYDKHYKNNSEYIDAEHHIEDDEYEEYIVPMIKKIFNKKCKTLTEHFYESLMINEHFVTPKTPEEMRKYADQVWKLLNDAYKYCGGMKGMDSPEQLIAETDIWKLVRRDGKTITAVITYSTKRGGRKACYMGAEQSERGRHDLLMISQEDAKLTDREAWCEVSGRAVSYKLKNGWTPIINGLAKEIMKDKEFDELCDDGFFYVRKIGGHKLHKIMLGNYGGKHHMETDEFIVNTIKELAKKYSEMDGE